MASVKSPGKKSNLTGFSETDLQKNLSILRDFHGKFSRLSSPKNNRLIEKGRFHGNFLGKFH